MKKQSRPALIVIALILLGAGGIWLYQQFFAPATTPQYRTQSVEQGEVKQIVSANGTLNPVSLVNVGTQVSGTVKKLHVDFNSKVSKGQILLELDDALPKAQQKQSEANVRSAAASLELATINEARLRDLFKREYISQQELDTAVQVKKSAEAQLQLVRAAVEKDHATLAYTVIRSPVAGVVVDRAVDVGQTVAASLQTPTLFKIAQDLSKMQIHANFAEADIGSIRVDQTANFSVDAFSGKKFKGIVQQIRLSPTIQQNVVTYDVVINVDNPGQLLMPGMTAYVSIAVEERKDVLLVPNAALRFKPTTAASVGRSENNLTKNHPAKREGFSATVYVLQGATLLPVSVTLGITDNRNTEIVGGELKAGDQVVTGDLLATGASPSTRPPMGRLF
ncbi:MAG: efflux RND transporter periplasmic adaptor subunit [Gallionellaceae bacterium]|jgi:HlyD family secretion protein